MTAKTSARILALIDALETKIKKGTVMPDYIEGLQRQLNDGTVLSSDDRYHQYAFELQALIYKAEGKQDGLAKCIGAAVEQAGSIQKLHSRLLKADARKDTTIASTGPTSKVRQSSYDKLSLLTPGEQTFLRHHGLEDIPDVDFLTRSVPVFVAMFVLSGGIYGTYWLYKNWQAVHEATEIRFSPLWRTLLSIIYIWPLFKIMVVLAKSRGFEPKYSGGALAAGYILTAFGGATYELSIRSSRTAALLIQVATSCLYVLFLALAQQSAVFVLSKRSGPKPEMRPVNYVELLFVVVGLLFVVASFTDYKTITPKSSGSATYQSQQRSSKR